jgi:hypothetical protein
VIPLIDNLLVTIAASLFIAISSSSVVVTLLTRRNRREREVDLRKLEEQRGLIGAEAAEVALRALRTELNAAYEDVEKRRTVIRVQDLHIEQLGETVRRQAKRIVRLEDWALVASEKLEQLGITDMPPVPREPNGSNGVPRG